MISRNHISQFEEALQAQDPFEALYKLAVSLKDAGMSQAELFSLFEKFQQSMVGDPQYNAIVDNMDFIWGGPWAKGHSLFPQMLTQETIDENERSNKE